MSNRQLFVSIFVLSLSLLCPVYTFSQSQITLSQSIKWISKESDYRFLYRESFTDAILLSKQINSSKQLEYILNELPELGVEFIVDTTRKHILVFKKNSSDEVKTRMNFIILNDESGERLAHASILINQSDRYVADEMGRFSKVFSQDSSQQIIEILYAGFQSELISIPFQNGIFDWSIRLKPLFFEGDEIIIQDSSLVVHEEQFSKISAGFVQGVDKNLVRTSQLLAAATTSSAFDRDIIIRGSSPDGVIFKLDGTTSFEHQHLFGLSDTYNQDALQIVGLFYDHIPARLTASSGGIMDIRTKNGSREVTQSVASLSNTSFNLHLNGPLASSAGTWTLGGKTSIMNQFSGLGNDDRIAWGLDTGREVQVVDSRYSPASTDLIIPGNPSVAFYDLQSKVHLEMNDGSVIQITGYVGGDDTKQTAQRYYQTSNSLRFDERFSLQPIETVNNWKQIHTGIAWFQTFSNWVISSTVSYGYYTSRFLKDDYTYLLSEPQDDAIKRSFIESYESKNQISEAVLDLSAQSFLTSDFSIEMGLAISNYALAYEEESFSYPLFTGYFTSWLFEPFIESDWRITPTLKLESGIRFHYFTDGDFTRLSPRFRLTWSPSSIVDYSVGFSKGYQFLNRLSLYNTVTSDVWIPATNNQAPKSMNHVFSSVQLKFNSQFSWTNAFYLKDLTNVRMHEINTRNYATSFNPEPWFTNHSLSAIGWESQLFYASHSSKAMLAYTLSKTTLTNSALNNGLAFPAYWDRKHQFKSSFEYRFQNQFSISLSGALASGMPAREPGSTGLATNRLDWYRRLDMGIGYNHSTKKATYSIYFSVYNVLNLKNAWYREEIEAFDSLSDNAELITVQADVLDLRFLPTLEFKVSF